MQGSEPGADEQPGRTVFATPRLQGVTTPKGGGAVRGIGEKLEMNLATGTASFSVPIATTPGRGGFELGLSLSYSSGAGAGPFGLGWALSVPSITRRTEKRLPRYDEDDVFLLSGAEDLVVVDTTDDGVTRVTRFKPRTEGLFARIERVRRSSDGDEHWRIVTKDNVTNFYGRSPASRIVDPSDRTRIYSWLLEETRDDRGNVAEYRYRAEDGAGVARTLSEESRFASEDETSFVATAQRYLKRILYANRKPFQAGDYCYEAVFDYGEHDSAHPLPDDDSRNVWRLSETPFSSFRAGFEVRSYRACDRVLMFHHFTELHASEATLVKATSFEYQPAGAVTYLTKVTQHGYVRQGSGYREAQLPALELGYEKQELHDRVQTVTGDGARSLAHGFDGRVAQWQDLDGEGLPGLLVSEPHGWSYLRNEGSGRLGAPTPLRNLPAPHELGSGGLQLADLDGDGRLEVSTYQSPLAGYFARTAEAGFEPFQYFKALPQIDWTGPNLRFIDLDGDGHGDALVTEDDVFVWYRSRGKDGFERAQWASRPKDERDGPAVLFNDGAESIHLLDMSGDGLLDIVRVRNGEVCYWPNLGWARFGRRVTMEGSPVFDSQDAFDPARLRFADIDGSGTTDIIYLSRHGAAVHYNQCGNGFAEGGLIQTLPVHVPPEQVTTTDLLGNGTACLLWTTPYDRVSPVRYVDLMGGKKPHVLRTIDNNLGALTIVEYGPSTQFYRADLEAGTPWLTRLSFPVQLVSRVTHVDFIARSQLTTRYAYHHGYFDGEERELGGFARVDEWDSESFFDSALPNTLTEPAPADSSSVLRLAPVRRTSWFHTGAWLEQTKLETALKREYGPRDANGALDPLAPLLPDTPSHPDWSVRDQKEATRALRGKPLRQEVFAEDGAPEAARPYVVTETSYQVRRLRSSGQREDDFGIFLVVPDQSFSAHYERQLGDARIQHQITLETDPFGNVLDSVAVAYGRRSTTISAHPDLPGVARANLAQQRDAIVRTLSRYTAAIDDARGVRAPIACEQRVYEVTGVVPKHVYFSAEELRDISTSLRRYTDAPGGGPERRKVEHTRIVFRSDDLAQPLPLGTTGVMAMPHEEYHLALTPDVLSERLTRERPDGSSELLVPQPASTLASDGGYVSRLQLVQGGAFPADPDADEDNGDWWAPSGRILLSPGVDAEAFDSPAAELDHARAHFFLPHRQRDAFGAWTHLRYDEHHLLVVDAIDAIGNRITAGTRTALGQVVHRVDYRVTQPLVVCDANRNRTEVAFDALGMVVGSAVRGKIDGAVEGDDLSDFAADVDDATLLLLRGAVDPRTLAATLLASATARFVYDVFAFARDRANGAISPPAVYSIARETHVSDLGPTERSKIQLSVSYSDGMGREIQKKIPAEPGSIVPGGAIVNPRWVGSGWVILNNKGKPVRRYEPFFTAAHVFEFARIKGVSATLFYDPLERVVATLHPNHSYEKTTFTPWQQTTWDTNDTVLSDPTEDADVREHFVKLPQAELLPTWYQKRISGELGADEQAAATAAARHNETPTTVHFDSLGRPVLSIAHNRYRTRPPDELSVDELAGTFTDLDIEGFQRAVWDPLDREVMRYDYDLRGRCVRTMSMDAASRWTLPDVADQPMLAWDSRGHTVRTQYDKLRRPVRVTLAGQAGSTAEAAIATTVYGETYPDAESLNLRGQALRSRDTAGEVGFIGRAKSSAVDEAYDFRGKPIFATRRLAKEYKRLPNWDVDAVESETFQVESRFDALGRPRLVISADGSESRPTFNEAGLLDRVDVSVKGAAPFPFVRNVDYDEKGQRRSIEYGNQVVTQYEHDPLTFRPTSLRTTRPNEDWPGDRSEPADKDRRPVGLQYLSYVHDAVGNIVSIRDDAQPKIFYAGDVTDGHCTFEYDAVYQLRRARGREHIGQAGLPHSTWNDEGRRQLAHPHSATAMRNYWQFYDYDKAGNIRELAHRAPQNGDFTRHFRYESESYLDSGGFSNVLTSTLLGTTKELDYPSDVHGNMLALGHLPPPADEKQPFAMVWDALDRLASSSKQSVTNGGTPETTYYVYDGSGERVRKVTEGYAGPGQTPSRMSERIYLGGSEVYRKYADASLDPVLERETLHVMDDKQRIAMVETRTKGTDSADATLVRYQFSNHLGTAAIEVDHDADVISYEEYHPYGTTAFHSVRKQTETRKRYRYTGKERDEETGLSYHSARYYAPWLTRWISADSLFRPGQSNSFHYADGGPVTMRDPSGYAPTPKQVKQLEEQIDESLKAIDSLQPDSPMARLPMRTDEDHIEAKHGKRAGGKNGSQRLRDNGQDLIWKDNQRTKGGKVEKTSRKWVKRTKLSLKDAKAAGKLADAGAAVLAHPHADVEDWSNKKLRNEAKAAAGWDPKERAMTNPQKGQQWANLTDANGTVVDAKTGLAKAAPAGPGKPGILSKLKDKVEALASNKKVQAAAGKARKALKHLPALSTVAFIYATGGTAHAAATGNWEKVKDDVKDSALDKSEQIPVVGQGIGAFRFGYGIGEAISELLPESAQDAIGGTINEIVNEGGWKHPFGGGM